MVRTRIPPSPTGNLHIGTARVALFNFLFARKFGGSVVLRIEDTDRDRSKIEYEKDIKEGLKWLGLEWDAFYRQSERIPIYRKYLEILRERGKVFYCPHLREETEGKVHFFCSERDNTLSTEGIIRFKTPFSFSDRGEAQNSISFDDAVRGKVVFHVEQIGDFSIAKSLDEPLYNFAVVIDDYEMEISHVIRGEDHISNTPKQILLQEALGFPRPSYAHLPLILGPDRTKLSKRHGATAIAEYRDRGYLPQAMINAMAFLGWNPGDEREFFTLEELIQEFSLERIKKGGSIFDIKRLNFINEHYLKELTPDDYAKEASRIIEKHYPKIDPEKREKIALLTRGNASTIVQSLEKFDLLLKSSPDDLDYPAELLMWKKTDRAKTLDALQKMKIVIENIPEEAPEDAIKEAILNAFGKEGDKGVYLWPLRVALYGQEASPGPFEGVAVSMAAEGKEKTIERVKKAISKLNIE